MSENLFERLEQDLCLNEKFRIRRKPEVKREFFAYVNERLSAKGYAGRADGDFKETTNLIFGDENTADLIFMAHYDTPKTNTGLKPFMFLFNLPGFIAQGIGMLLVLAAVVVGATLLGIYLHWAFSVLWVAAMSVWVFPSYHMFDNKFNFNDNTSGCIALLYLAERFAAEYPELKARSCFVFSDREEAGTVGAKKLKKQLIERLGEEGFKKKILFNFDCVGGRDKDKYIMTNSSDGLVLAEEIRDGAKDIGVYRSPILNMDSFQFGKIPAVSFCSASPRYGLRFLLESKDIHTNRDDFLDTAQIREYGDLTLRYLTGKYLTGDTAVKNGRKDL
ncbi:MAG: Zn-dependent exopeptidase M28 [Clostridiales bacterium]|jgi:hypothetical protein|nr:Zn-dependent exopeptidase M28 [Clostridiales bacterium]